MRFAKALRYRLACAPKGRSALPQRLKVLVVDDDPVVLEIARARLEKMGHEVVTRSSAIGTTATIIGEKPDVVLLDVEMPLLSGDDIMHTIHEKQLLDGGADVPVILYSGTEPSELERLVAETGAIGAIHKARDSAAFTAAFERLVGKL
jgi:CheY-like chemotaxis protein